MRINSTDTGHDELPDWIQQLRSQSWQIEILIAGSTVYTLFYLSDYLQGYFYSIYPGIDFTITRTLLLFGVYLVSRILLVGFIGNLIIRSVWLAYLGINFAFPRGVNFDGLKNNEESKRILQGQASTLERVSRLERLSKLSYSISVLLAIFMTSVVISTITIHFVLEKLGVGFFIYEAWFSYTIAVLIAIIQLGVIDRLFLSKKSSRPWINKVKLILSLVLEYITLSFLFRREFLTLKSNVNQIAFSSIVAFILFLSTFITAIQIGKYWPYGTIKMSFMDDRTMFDIDHDPSRSIYNYDTNVSPDKSVLRMSIQSDIVRDRYLKLFVTSWMQFDEMLAHNYEKYQYPFDFDARSRNDFNREQQEADSIFNLVINDLFIVDIDGVELQDLRWRSTNHEKSFTKGYITYIDISELVEDEHLVTMYVNYLGDGDKVARKKWKEIAFWKE